MSSRRGKSAAKKGAPKHQNEFAFKHNPNSKKTRKILAMPNVGLCRRCSEKIEWRKKYRKYKPLTQPAVCRFCKQKTVTSAYHSACKPCAKQRRICAFCCESNEIVKEDDKDADQKLAELDEQNKHLPLRQRKTMMRQAEREMQGEEAREGKEATTGDVMDDDASIQEEGLTGAGEEQDDEMKEL
uniref:Uncharacterized protein n=1 Tax=Heterosigma akashiwo TaxID=2829 RepID=A0A6V3DVU9_HETAK|mmetsp:Transcript_38178/g.59644  ORF Transcript_38178/g.59644 Transcript_38178/m.59644 type:complete len:185 (+) Transcript_38178:84-638(+)